jgi:hypothetical protein
LALVISTTALAAPAPITGGSLTWGVKESFRAYVTGPIAHGSVSVSGGAIQNPSGAFQFPAAAVGSYEGAAGTVAATFTGSVVFTGHDGVLEMNVSNIRVNIAGATGTLVADLVTRPLPEDLATPQPPVSFPNTQFATLNLTGITPTANGSSTTWTNVPVVLTAAGSAAFASF